jgi:hypothetical protein
VIPGAVPTTDRRPGPPEAPGGSGDDNAASPSDNGPSLDEPKSSEPIDRADALVEKDEVKVELAASSNDPNPLPYYARARHLQAPRSLLAVEPVGRKAGSNSGPPIDRAREARAAIRPASRAVAAGSGVPAAANEPATRNGCGADGDSNRVEMENTTIAARSQPADGPQPYPPATAGPAEVPHSTWGIVLAGLTSAPGPTDRPGAGKAGHIHMKSYGKERRVNRGSRH